jgi:hypothetical protein
LYCSKVAKKASLEFPLLHREYNLKLCIRTVPGTGVQVMAVFTCSKNPGSAGPTLVQHTITHKQEITPFVTSRLEYITVLKTHEQATLVCNKLFQLYASILVVVFGLLGTAVAVSTTPHQALILLRLKRWRSRTITRVRITFFVRASNTTVNAPSLSS